MVRLGCSHVKKKIKIKVSSPTYLLLLCSAYADCTQMSFHEGACGVVHKSSSHVLGLVLVI